MTCIIFDMHRHKHTHIYIYIYIYGIFNDYSSITSWCVFSETVSVAVNNSLYKYFVWFVWSRCLLCLVSNHFSHDCRGSLSTPLTHWGRVTHICVGKLTIIDSDNDLSPDRRQAIIWTNAGILWIGNKTQWNINHNSYIYTPAQRSWRGGILDSPCPSVCPSVRLSVRLSVDDMVSGA